MPAAARPRRPPFCPNPVCDFHRDPRGWRFTKKGFYERETRPRRIQRYRCTRCGRNFSSQTFSLTYWLRRPDLLRPVFWRIVGCSALRQIAAEFGVSHTTVLRHVERLGRHCLLVHERWRPKGPPAEALVLDGLRSLSAHGGNRSAIQGDPRQQRLGIGQRGRCLQGLLSLGQPRFGQIKAALQIQQVSGTLFVDVQSAGVVTVNSKPQLVRGIDAGGYRW